MTFGDTLRGGGTARRAVAVAGLGFAGYLSFSRLATLWEFPGQPVAALWPAVGIVIGTVMLVRTQWWFVLIGAWIAQVVDLLIWGDDLPTRTMVALVAAQVVEQLLATMIALAIIDPPEILRRATRTVPMAVAGTALSAAVGAATFVAIADVADASMSFRAWCIGHGVGILIAAPTVYGLSQIRRLPHGLGARLELALSVAASCAVTVWAFEVTTPIVLLPLPMIGWLAVRFGLAASAPVALVVAMWGTWRTSEGSGPFGDLDNAVYNVQLFTIAAALTAVIVGAESTELDRRRRRLSGLLASVPDVVVVLDDKGTILEDFTTRDGAGSLVGERIVDTVMDGFGDAVAEAQTTWQTTGQSSMTAEHLSTRTQRVDTYETKFRRIASNQAIAVARNVTQRLAERAEIQRQARRWRDLMSGSFQGLAEIDRDGICFEANERLASIVGRPSMSLLGTHMNDLVSAHYWPGWEDDLERMTAGERITAEVTVAGRTAVIVVMPRVDGTGAFSGALVLALDTTPTLPHR